MTSSDNWPEYLFHLPTVIVITIISLVLIWQLYDVGFSVGDRFLRVNTSRGNVSIYWVHGCCDLDW